MKLHPLVRQAEYQADWQPYQNCSRISWRKGAMVVLALLVALASFLLPHSALAAPVAQEYTYAECSRMDEAEVQAEMTVLARSVLVEGSNGLDIDALVASSWRDLDANATFDAAVDAGIARVTAERGYWERFWSGWSADKAEEFAGQVAAYAFEDVALKAKLDEVSTAIAGGLVIELESAAARSASSALLCLQSYIGEQYSSTLFLAFQNTVSKELAADIDLSEAQSVHISPLEMHTKGLTGVGVIVATQITRRVAQSLAQKITGRLAGKIAGRVLGRLGSSVIPYIGWAVGAGLLIWDLWEGSQGALPTIRDALQAEEVKQEVRAEISVAVAEGVAAEVDTLASTMAATMVGQWQQFCQNHGVVCQLATENSTFRALLNNTPVIGLTRLIQLTDFFWAEFGAEAGKKELIAALNDGTMVKLLAAPEAVDAILAWSASPTTALAWATLAGNSLPQVVELRLYETIDPLRMTELSLAALLAIDDNYLIHKLGLLPIDQLLTLLRLPTRELTQILATATSDELSWLAQYMAEMPIGEANVLAQQLANGQTTIALLQTPVVAEVTTRDNAANRDNAVGDNMGAEVGQIGGIHMAEVTPVVGIAKAVWDLWSPWANNGVVVAAVVLVLLLLAVGVGMALRREFVDPPL